MSDSVTPLDQVKNSSQNYTAIMPKLRELDLDFPGGSEGKASVYNAGDLDSIPGSGRFPGGGNDNQLQYSCLESPMDGGAWCRLLSMGWQRVGHD